MGLGPFCRPCLPALCSSCWGGQPCTSRWIEPVLPAHPATWQPAVAGLGDRSDEEGSEGEAEEDDDDDEEEEEEEVGALGAQAMFEDFFGPRRGGAAGAAAAGAAAGGAAGGGLKARQATPARPAARGVLAGPDSESEEEEEEEEDEEHEEEEDARLSEGEGGNGLLRGQRRGSWVLRVPQVHAAAGSGQLRLACQWRLLAGASRLSIVPLKTCCGAAAETCGCWSAGLCPPACPSARPPTHLPA